LAAKSYGNFLDEYFEQSRRPIYSIVSSAPFFIAYQLGVTFLMPRQLPVHRQRNGAEKVLHDLGMLIGNRHVAYLLPVLAGMLLLYALHRRDLRQRRAGARAAGRSPRLWGGFNPTFLAIIYLEGLILAMPLAAMSYQIPRILSAGPGAAETLLFRLTTMCGAGAWEELLFRLFLCTGLYFFAHKLLSMEKVPAGILAAVTSGVVFSLFHGFGSRPLDFYVFAAAAGVYLAIICHFRSFGVAVAAHALYDIFAVLTG
jgi:membrane protease YdiL (CAAX protease family)